MAFRRPKNVDFQPRKQRQDIPNPPEIPETQGPSDEEFDISRAENIVKEFDKTIQFSDWLTSLIDERIKDVVVQVDPEQHPEVAMAMERLFGNTVNRNLSGRSYVEVLDALRDVDRLEFEESQNESLAIENEFIENLPQAGETIDSAAPETLVPDEDDIALREAVEEDVFKAGKSTKSRFPKWFQNMFKRSRLISYNGGNRAGVPRENEIRRRLDDIIKE